MTISDPVALIILFGVGIIAGFINVTAGGGSTLTLPVSDISRVGIFTRKWHEPGSNSSSKYFCSLFI